MRNPMTDIKFIELINEILSDIYVDGHDAPCWVIRNKNEFIVPEYMRKGVSPKMTGVYAELCMKEEQKFLQTKEEDEILCESTLFEFLCEILHDAARNTGKLCIYKNAVIKACRLVFNFTAGRNADHYISQKNFADLLGVSAKAVESWEYGDRVVKLDVVNKALQLCNIKDDIINRILKKL